MNNFGDLTYQTVPVQERMKWQGSKMPHPGYLQCLCCNAEEKIKHFVRDKRYRFHYFKSGKCINCGMAYGIAAMTVECGSKPNPEGLSEQDTNQPVYRGDRRSKSSNR